MESQEQTNLGIEDIYGDFADFDLGNTVEKLQGENKELKTQVALHEMTINNLTDALLEEQKLNENLKNNISSLFRTAKSELDRRDATIVDLRKQLDNVIFRKKGNFFKNHPNVYKGSINKVSYTENQNDNALQTTDRYEQERSDRDTNTFNNYLESRINEDIEASRVVNCIDFCTDTKKVGTRLNIFQQRHNKSNSELICENSKKQVDFRISENDSLTKSDQNRNNNSELICENSKKQVDPEIPEKNTFRKNYQNENNSKSVGENSSKQVDLQIPVKNSSRKSDQNNINSELICETSKKKVDPEIPEKSSSRKYDQNKSSLYKNDYNIRDLNYKIPRKHDRKSDRRDDSREKLSKNHVLKSPEPRRASRNDRHENFKISMHNSRIDRERRSQREIKEKVNDHKKTSIQSKNNDKVEDKNERDSSRRRRSSSSKLLPKENLEEPEDSLQNNVNEKINTNTTEDQKCDKNFQLQDHSLQSFKNETHQKAKDDKRFKNPNKDNQEYSTKSTNKSTSKSFKENIDHPQKSSQEKDNLIKHRRKGSSELINFLFEENKRESSTTDSDPLIENKKSKSKSKKNKHTKHDSENKYKDAKHEGDDRNKSTSAKSVKSESHSDDKSKRNNKDEEVLSNNIDNTKQNEFRKEKTYLEDPLSEKEEGEYTDDSIDIDEVLDKKQKSKEKRKRDDSINSSFSDDSFKKPSKKIIKEKSRLREKKDEENAKIKEKKRESEFSSLKKHSQKESETATVSKDSISRYEKTTHNKRNSKDSKRISHSFLKTTENGRISLEENVSLQKDKFSQEERQTSEIKSEARKSSRKSDYLPVKQNINEDFSNAQDRESVSKDNIPKRSVTPLQDNIFGISSDFCVIDDLQPSEKSNEISEIVENNSAEKDSSDIASTQVVNKIKETETNTRQILEESNDLPGNLFSRDSAKSPEELAVSKKNKSEKDLIGTSTSRTEENLDNKTFNNLPSRDPGNSPEEVTVVEKNNSKTDLIAISTSLKKKTSENKTINNLPSRDPGNSPEELTVTEKNNSKTDLIAVSTSRKKKNAENKTIHNLASNSPSRNSDKSSIELTVDIKNCRDENLIGTSTSQTKENSENKTIHNLPSNSLSRDFDNSSKELTAAKKNNNGTNLMGTSTSRTDENSDNKIVIVSDILLNPGTSKSESDDTESVQNMLPLDLKLPPFEKLETNLKECKNNSNFKVNENVKIEEKIISDVPNGRTSKTSKKNILLERYASDESQNRLKLISKKNSTIGINTKDNKKDAFKIDGNGDLKAKKQENLEVKIVTIRKRKLLEGEIDSEKSPQNNLPKKVKIDSQAKENNIVDIENVEQKLQLLHETGLILSVDLGEKDVIDNRSPKDNFPCELKEEKNIPVILNKTPKSSRGRRSINKNTLLKCAERRKSLRNLKPLSDESKESSKIDDDKNVNKNIESIESKMWESYDATDKNTDKCKQKVGRQSNEPTEAYENRPEENTTNINKNEYQQSQEVNNCSDGLKLPTQILDTNSKKSGGNISTEQIQHHSESRTIDSQTINPSSEADENKICEVEPKSTEIKQQNYSHLPLPSLGNVATSPLDLSGQLPKGRKRITPTRVKETPVCSFKNILGKNSSEMKIFSKNFLMETTLNLTDDGEIPILHLEENHFSNMGDLSQKTFDRSIIKLLDCMNVSNLECDISKLNEKTDSSIPSGTLTFENAVSKHLCGVTDKVITVNKTPEKKEMSPHVLTSTPKVDKNSIEENGNINGVVNKDKVSSEANVTELSVKINSNIMNLPNHTINKSGAKTDSCVSNISDNGTNASCNQSHTPISGPVRFRRRCRMVAVRRT